MKIKREHLILFFIFLLGLLIRIYISRDESFIGVDAVFYTHMGKNLIESGKYVYGESFNLGIFLPPGYPLLVGLTNLFVNDLFFSGKLISLFFSVITLFLFYGIGSELNNKESGLFAAFTYAVYPGPIIRRTLAVHTEGAFFFFLFLSIYLILISLRKDKFFIYMLLGASIGIAYLVRAEGLLLLCLPFLRLDIHSPFKSKGYLLKICSVFLFFILISSPYLLFLKHSTGRFTISGKSNVVMLVGTTVNFKDREDYTDYDKKMYSLNEEKNQLKAFEQNTYSIIDYIFKNPFIFIKRFKNNIINETQILGKLLMPVMIPLFFAFFDKELFRKKKRLLLVPALIYFVFYASFLVIERYVYLVVLFLSLFSSTGFVNSQSAYLKLLDFYEIRKNKVALFVGRNIKLIIIILLILGFFIYHMVLYDKWDIPVEHVKASYYLKNKTTAGYEELNIMARFPWVSFYSDSKYTYIPYSNYKDLINFAKLYKVDYIVIDERSLRNWDAYDELIQMDKYSPDVELFYEENSGKLIKLFKVKYR